MLVENKFYVGLRDINNLQELKNTGLLSYLEDVACMHSEIAGYGVTKIEEVKSVTNNAIAVDLKNRYEERL